MNGQNIYPNENPPPYSLHPDQNDNLQNLNFSNSLQQDNLQHSSTQQVNPQNNPSQHVPPYHSQNYTPQSISPQYIIIPPQTANSNLPNYQSTVPPNIQQEPNLMTANNFDLCPYCRSGTLIARFTFLGLLLAIFLFPFGIVCLFILMKKYCTNCKMSFNVF